MKTLAYAIPDSLRVDPNKLTLADAITVIHAAKVDGIHDVSFTTKVEILARIYGMDAEGMMGKPMESVNGWFAIFMDAVRHLGLVQGAAKQEAESAASKMQPEPLVTVMGHTFEIPVDLGKEPAKLFIGLDNKLQQCVGMHEVEVMPHILGTLLREPGAAYDVNTNGARTEVMMHMDIVTAARICAFFFFSSTDFRASLHLHCPAYASLMPQLNVLAANSSLSDGDMLRCLLASRI